jgi:hypothetical protein
MIIEIPTGARPKLTSVSPSTIHGAPVTLAFCEKCATVQVFNNAYANSFPDSGYWTECRACQEWTFFFRIEHGRVVHIKNGEPVLGEGIR